MRGTLRLEGWLRAWDAETAARSERWLGELARDGVEFTLRVDR
ncbi:hypothetical protein [Streptomyces sp. NPDC007929]